MKCFVTALLLLLLHTAAFSQQQDSTAIVSLLKEFLQRVDERAMHDRFWDETLVYTGSSGRRIGKQDILKGFDGPRSGGDNTSYQAEAIQVHVFGQTAMLVFRLVAQGADASQKPKQYYNSGMLRKADGLWKVVMWQATHIPDTGE